MNAFAYSYGTYNQVIVTDGTPENSYTYDFGTDQDIEVSVTESIRLAELEVSAKQPPMPVAI